MKNHETKTGLARSLLALLKPDPWILPVVLGLGVLSSLAEGVGITLFIPFLANLTGTSGTGPTGNVLVDLLNGFYSSFGSGQRLFVICVSILACVLLKALLAFAYRSLCGWVDTTVSYRLRSGIFHRLLTVGYTYFERTPNSRLYHALDTQSWRTSQALWQWLDMLAMIGAIIIFLGILALISWQLTLLSLSAVLLMSRVSDVLTRRAATLGDMHTREEDAMKKRIIESLAGMKEIRIFGQEAYENGRFRRTADNLRRVGRKLSSVQAFSGPMHEILAVLLMVSVLLLGSMRSPEDLGPMLVFLLLLYRLQPAFVALGSTRVQIHALQADVEAIHRLLREIEDPAPTSGGITITGLRHGISFDRVSFTYEAGTGPAVRDVSIAIEAGRTTALVGPSGAGKTTLVNLILRFHDPASGSISADGIQLKDLDLASWRARIAFVSQEPYIFDSTVKENIAYGMADATDDVILQAARKANAHDFIMRLPDGYEGRVGSRGSLLSAGERQRLALARAIAHNPDILILDEATNALDGVSEQAVREAVQELRKDRTVVIIAHRLSMVETADHIIVLDRGEVREQGAFQTLLNHNGLFAQMYRLQHSVGSQ